MAPLASVSGALLSMDRFWDVIPSDGALLALWISRLLVSRRCFLFGVVPVHLSFFALCFARV